MNKTQQIMPVTFVASRRISVNFVLAQYQTSDGESFVVEWNNFDEATGEIGNFDLYFVAAAENNELAEFVSSAIKGGENGENCDLYLALRDTFNANDAQNVADSGGIASKSFSESVIFGGDGSEGWHALNQDSDKFTGEGDFEGWSKDVIEMALGTKVYLSGGEVVLCDLHDVNGQSMRLGDEEETFDEILIVDMSIFTKEFLKEKFNKILAEKRE